MGAVDTCWNCLNTITFPPVFSFAVFFVNACSSKEYHAIGFCE